MLHPLYLHTFVYARNPAPEISPRSAFPFMHPSGRESCVCNHLRKVGL